MATNVTVVARGVPGLEDTGQVLAVRDGTTVAELLRTLVPTTERPTNLIVTLNGRYVPAAELDTTILQESDRLEIMPLVVGG